MPLFTIQQMAELALPSYHYPGRSENNFRPKLPTTIIICNVLDHLAVKGTLNRIANTATLDSIELFSNQVKDFVNYLEHAATELKNKLNSSTIFTSPPGFRQRPTNLQQFAYVVIWVTFNHGI